MKVLLATESRDRGSTSRTLEGWTRLLGESGFDSIVTVGGDGPLLDALRAGGTDVRARPLRVVPDRKWPIPFAWAVGRLAVTVRRSGAVLVHVNEHEHHPVAAHAARLARVPVVTHVRFRVSETFARWLFRAGRTPERLFFTSQTQMRDCAEAVRTVVPEHRWRLLPNGLDLSTFGTQADERSSLRAAWGIADDAVALGMACAISERKRVDHFIRLVARLRTRGIDAYGFIAGRAYFAEDERLIARLGTLTTGLGVEQFVRFLGYVEPSEPLYHAWDLCVSTSAYETFGMTVLEAMACRCPVVGYPGGAVAEVVGSAGAIVPDGDEEALFGECVRLATNTVARRAAGARGRERAEREYDLRQIVPRLVDEYRHVI